MTRDQAKHDARTAPEPDQAQPNADTSAVIVTEYRVTVRIDMTAAVTMQIDGPSGEVTVEAELDARDVRGRITRHVTLDGPRLNTTLLEGDLPDWEPSNHDVVRCDRALRAEANTQYINQAEQWYALYQDKTPSNDAGAPGVPAE